MHMRIWEFYELHDLIPIIQRGQKICNAIENQKENYLENSTWPHRGRRGIPSGFREESQAINYAIEWVIKYDAEEFN